MPFAAPIDPQAQRDQDDHAVPTCVVTLALAAILVETVLLGLHAEPNAIEVYDRRHLGDRFAMHVRESGFELIDALIESTQAHACSHGGCPFLAELA
ncbi:MAG: hypothetical protein ACXVDN_15740 [Ktedonobacteraceae bacterium]